MINRERILEAAARVYAKHGFRGATTRLIALEAGVNEVTLFRTFGSKSALLQAVLAQQDSDCSGVPLLPAQPVDPVAELTAFTEASLQKLREIRPLLVQTMSELEERPEAADFACRGRTAVHDMLWEYSNKLHAQSPQEPADVATAVTMLTSTMMGDAMGRPMVPEAYPPLDEAAA
ncbi:MAG: TetR/AcrR family transcriptional regulator, partial [Gemmatimonadaceae bacterium]